MATDRYSDDHKIVVGGGSGTLTVDAVLDITGGLDVTGNLDVSSDGDIKLDANDLLDLRGETLQILVANSISVNAGGNCDINTDNFDLSVDNLNVSGDEIDISAVASCSITGGYDLNLESDGHNLNLTAGADLNISADTINITLNGSSPQRINVNNNSANCDIRFDVQTSATVTLPASSFQISSTGNGENNGSVLILNGGSGNNQFFFAPLPDSIPNGSIIATVGIRYSNTDASNDDTVTLKIRSFDPETGSSYSDLDSVQFTCTATTNEYLTETFNATVNKSTSNHISLLLGGIGDLYIYCVTLSYVTDRININQ